jgi:dTDP-4-dehydrorhamnose 3,5-epimerase
MTPATLPPGVVVHPLTAHIDARGTLTEIYRDSWDLGCRPVQVNAVWSEAGVLRGVHVHARHADHLCVVGGRMLLGLHDLRPTSAAARTSCLLELDGRRPHAVVVPIGVAHGFYFLEPSTLVYGVSDYWSPDDELACRWDSPELALAWPTHTPILSERDAAAGDYGTFVDTFHRLWTVTTGYPVRTSGTGV